MKAFRLSLIETGIVHDGGGDSHFEYVRFPVTPYCEQWTRLLAGAAELRTFIEENKGTLKLKPRAGE
jgi:hypothetical protein